MVIKLVSEAIFYILAGILGIYSVAMVYVLLRFGRSKILALLLCAFYLIILTSLYAAALQNLSAIHFPADSQFLL